LSIRVQFLAAAVPPPVPHFDWVLLEANRARPFRVLNFIQESFMSSISLQQDKAVPMLDLGLQYQSIRTEIREAIDHVLESQHFILGPEVKALESEVALYCGRKFGIGVASGTDALTLALCGSGIGAGDEVIVPSFSFIATADCVSLLGATPVFADIDPITFCIDPALIEAKITARTKALVPVHLYGQSADMDPVMEIARRHNLRVIEDNAQAIGATYKGRKTASMGDIGCLSFFPSKNLGGYGDGGMVVTDSEETAQKLRSLRAHGSLKKYFSTEQGWNSRLDEIQAAILRVKLRHLDSWGHGRRERAALYDRLLQSMPEVTLPAIADGRDHVFHQYTVRVPQRDKVQKLMTARGVASTVYYPTPIHLQPIYSSLGYKSGDLLECERAAQEALSLPIYPELTDQQIEQVASALAQSLREI
jgi:dTDP-4-amino-4,6-dideoxygalactose transaminase